MDAAEASTELNESLAALETALLTPVVSGELESWVRTAEGATNKLSQKLPTFLKMVLHPQYAEIAKSDAELLTRVQQLIEEDQNLILEQEAFRNRMSDFAKRASQIKKDEAQVANERTKLEQDGIALILRIKRQRAAADTWLTEAAYRDRGPVD
jgi:regulator of replication initiation timing